MGFITISGKNINSDNITSSTIKASSMTSNDIFSTNMNAKNISVDDIKSKVGFFDEISFNKLSGGSLNILLDDVENLELEKLNVDTITNKNINSNTMTTNDISTNIVHATGIFTTNITADLVTSTNSAISNLHSDIGIINNINCDSGIIRNFFAQTATIRQFITETLISDELFSLSDITQKKNIKYNHMNSDLLDSLNVIEYNYKYEEDTHKKHFGFIAQEIEEKYPNLVERGDDNKLRIKSIELIPLLLLYSKNMKSEMQNLQLEIQKLKEQKV
jgi:hypothetical protein